MSNAEPEHYLTDYEHLQGRLNDDWLSEQRHLALTTFRDHGFPTTRHESWKYTDVKAIARNTFTASSEKAIDISTNDLANVRFQELDYYELVFVNGQFRNELSQLDGLTEGVIICDLAEAIETQKELLAANLSSYTDNNISTFTTLNTAFIEHGAFIYIPEKVRLEKPLNLLFLSKMQSASFTTHPRNIIVLDIQAKAEIIESYISLDDSKYFMNTVTEVSLHGISQQT